MKTLVSEVGPRDGLQSIGRRRDVAANLKVAKRLVPAFERDYHRFVRRMLAGD